MYITIDVQSFGEVTLGRDGRGMYDGTEKKWWKKEKSTSSEKARKEQLKQEDQDGGDVSAVGGWREKRADS